MKISNLANQLTNLCQSWQGTIIYAFVKFYFMGWKKPVHYILREVFVGLLRLFGWFCAIKLAKYLYPNLPSSPSPFPFFVPLENP
jgi:hypothetical protein